MNVLWLFDDVNHFSQENIQPTGVPILAASIKNETNSLKTFDPALVLCRLTAEVAGVKCHFLKIC